MENPRGFLILAYLLTSQGVGVPEPVWRGRPAWMGAPPAETPVSRFGGIPDPAPPQSPK